MRVFMVIFALFLTACSEEIKSHQWWTEHPKEATEKYLECKKTGNDTPNCRNVLRAKRNIAHKYEPMMKIIEEEAEAIKREILQER